MNLLQKLMASARISDPLEFGINENVILQSVTNEDQIWDGQVLEKNCHLRFQKLNTKGTAVKEFRYSYFNSNPTEDKHPVQHLLTQLEQLTELATAMSAKAGEQYSKKASDIIESEENLIKKARSKKLAAPFQKELVDAFVVIAQKVIPAKPKLRLKVVTSWNGKYPNLPNSTPMVESMDIATKDSILSVSHQETINHLKVANNPAASNGQLSADSNVEKPKTNPVLGDL